MRDEQGAIMLVAVFMGVFLAGMLFYVVGIADAAIQRSSMQDAADAVTFSAAVVHAKGMNMIALANIVMAGLLSVLVAFRLVQTLAAVGMATILAIPAPAVWPLAPLLGKVAQQAEQAFDKAKPRIDDALGLVNTLAHGIAQAAPLAAEARAVETGIVAYRPRVAIGGVIPDAWRLPVEDGDTRVLCEKAGEFAASVALTPIMLPLRGNAIADAVEDGLQSVLASLSKATPEWFCGMYDGEPPRHIMEQQRRLPEMDADRRCREAKTEADLEACDEAAQDMEQAVPDGDSGDCQQACDADGPYFARAAAARHQCQPGSHDGLEGYLWQERVIVRTYRREGNRLVPALDIPEETRQVRLRQGARPPCGPGGSVAEGWRTGTGPLCSDEESAAVESAGALTRRRVTEVSQLLGCTAVVKVDVTPKGNSSEESEPPNGQQSGQQNGKQGNQPNTKPLRLKADVVHGGEPFQMRGFALGEQLHPMPERIVAAAAAGEPNEAYLIARQGGRLSLAQAEYHYDGELDDPMWDPGWTARLRRLQFLEPDDDEDQDEGQNQNKQAGHGGSGSERRSGGQSSGPSHPSDQAQGGGGPGQPGETEEDKQAGKQGLLDECGALPICQTLQDPSIDQWVTH